MLPATPARVLTATLVALAVLAATIVLTTLAGSSHVDLLRALHHQSPDYEIVFALRLSRVLLAALTGGALSVAGLLFQTLVRDSLADPYTLGVASGGSLGAVLAICFGLRSLGGMPAMGAAAFVGASCTLLLVWTIASRGSRLSSFTLLLAGVTVNSISMALILFLQNLANFSQSFAIVRWLMGGVEPQDYSSLAVLALVVVATVFYVFWRAPQWNLLAVSEEWVEARGVSVRPLMISGFVAGSLLTASVTCFTGPIGFLGLIVPHALRLRFGADHRILVPISFLGGAAFLAVCDTLARTLLSPTDIPVGVITALLGGPFFIWLLSSRRRSLWL